MTTQCRESTSQARAFEKGQRLYCAACGAEVEVISPCTCKEPHQVLRCCGQDMAPATGTSVNLNVEG